MSLHPMVPYPNEIFIRDGMIVIRAKQIPPESSEINQSKKKMKKNTRKRSESEGSSSSEYGRAKKPRRPRQPKYHLTGEEEHLDSFELFDYEKNGGDLDTGMFLAFV